MTKDRAVFILDKSIEYLLYLLIFFVPISISAIEILFISSMIIFIAKKILKPDFEFFKDYTHFFLIVFFVFCALSLFNSGMYLGKSLRAIFTKWLEYLIFFIMVENTINTPRRVRNAIFILIASSALIGLDAVFQKVQGIDFLLRRDLIVGRMTAAFKTPNSLAAYLVPILLLAITLLFSKYITKRHKHFLLILIIILSIVLISTFARGGWLGFIAGLSLLLFLLRDIKKASIPLLVFLAILLATPALRERMIASGDAQRLKFFSATWAMIRENPFLGKGVGTYMDYFTRYSSLDSAWYAHNSYMQIWAETGIFSLLSFLAFLTILLVKGIKSANKNKDFILLGLGCGVFGFLVHSFFDNQFYSVQLSFLFWLLAGLISGIFRRVA